MPISQKYSGHIDPRSKPAMIYPASGAVQGGGIILEIGPGRGDFLFHLAETNPGKLVYGVEIKGKRFEKLMRRRDARKLSNIILIQGDAMAVVPEYFTESSIEEVHINFPDPWPKKRHIGHRVLNERFLWMLIPLLKLGGTLSIATDVKWYAEEAFRICDGMPKLKAADSAAEHGDFYPTFFAQKWRKAGRPIYRRRWQKTKAGEIVPGL